MGELLPLLFPRQPILAMAPGHARVLGLNHAEELSAAREEGGDHLTRLEKLLPGRGILRDALGEEVGVS